MTDRLPNLEVFGNLSNETMQTTKIYASNNLCLEPTVSNHTQNNTSLIYRKGQGPSLLHMSWISMNWFPRTKDKRVPDC